MNDEFENNLMRIAVMPRHDETRAWKADILALAQREAHALPLKRLLPPPRLMLSWAAAWVVICVLRFSEPPNPAPNNLDHFTVATTARDRGADANSSSPTLFAYHTYLTLNEP